MKIEKTKEELLEFLKKRGIKIDKEDPRFKFFTCGYAVGFNDGMKKIFGSWKKIYGGKKK